MLKHVNSERMIFDMTLLFQTLENNILISRNTLCNEGNRNGLQLQRIRKLSVFLSVKTQDSHDDDKDKDKDK